MPAARGELSRRAVLAGAGVFVAGGSLAASEESGWSTGSRQRVRFVPAAKASSLVDFIGVNTHFNFRHTAYGETERVMALVEDLGVRHIRDHVTTAPQVRHAFKHLHRKGVVVQGVCSDLQDATSMQEVMAGVVESFRKPARVFSGFEPLNEPNNDGVEWVGPTATKTQALREARDALGLQAIPVLAPALARINRGGTTTAVQAAALGSLAQFVDLGNMHVYPRLQVPSNDIVRFKRYAQMVAGHKPIVCSEAGYFNAMNYEGTAYPTPQDVAARYYPKLVMEHWLRGTKRLFAYELLDDYDPGNAQRESNFGLVAVSGSGPSAVWTPKPAYTALRNLMGIFHDKPGRHFATGMRIRVAGPTDLRSVLFVKRNGVGHLAVWRDVSSYEAGRRTPLAVAAAPVRVRFDRPRHVSVYDPVISRHRLADLGTGGRVELSVADSLLILKIR